MFYRKIVDKSALKFMTKRSERARRTFLFTGYANLIVTIQRMFQVIPGTNELLNNSKDPSQVLLSIE